MSVTIRQIHAFLAVAQEGTFTKAAERMQIAQPALSQLIRELEKALGIRIFDRTTRRVELTDGGREFHGAAVKILHDLEAAIRSANDLAERKRGRIVVAAPPLLSAVALPPAIVSLKATYPGLQVAIIDAGNEFVVDAVRFGRADCGIGTFHGLEDGIERSPIARDTYMLFFARDSRFAARKTVDWNELENETVVTVPRDSGTGLLVEMGFDTAHIPLQPAYEVSQISTALALVRAGLGIAILPSYAREVAPDGVHASRLTAPSITREIVMIRQRSRSVSPALAAFEVLLRRHVRQLVPREGT